MTLFGIYDATRFGRNNIVLHLILVKTG